MARRQRRSHHSTAIDPLAAKLGAHVRQLREARGFTFDAFAEELGRGYVSDLERGKVVPKLTTLAKLAELLELEIPDVVALDATPRQVLLTIARDLTVPQLRRLIREARAMAERTQRRTSSQVPQLLNPAPAKRRRKSD